MTSWSWWLAVLGLWKLAELVEGLVRLGLSCHGSRRYRGTH